MSFIPNKKLGFAQESSHEDFGGAFKLEGISYESRHEILIVDY